MEVYFKNNPGNEKSLFYKFFEYLKEKYQQEKTIKREFNPLIHTNIVHYLQYLYVISSRLLTRC
jgi:hypothetical protein